MTGKRPFWQGLTDKLSDDLRRTLRTVGDQLNEALDQAFGHPPPREQTRPVVDDTGDTPTPPGAGPVPDGAIPASALESGTAFFSRLSGLSTAGFAPRHPVPPGLIRAYEITQNLAQTLQPSFGIALGRTRAGMHLQNSFADAFAILALARHGTPLDQLDRLAVVRNARLLTGNLTDWTGLAATAAAKTARNLAEKGELAAMTTDQLLAEAAKLARTHALPESGLRTIIDRRGRVYAMHGLSTYGDEGSLTQDGRVSDSTGGVEALELVVSALRSPDKPLKSAAPLFEALVRDLPGVAYMPGELRYPAGRRAALETYRADLDRCIADAAGSPGLADAILQRERQRTIEQGLRHERWSPAERDGPIQSTSLTLQRLKVIDSIPRTPTPAALPQTPPPSAPPPSAPPQARRLPGQRP